MSEQPSFVAVSTMKHIFILINTYSLQLTITVLVIIAFVIFKELMKHNDNKPHVRVPYKNHHSSNTDHQSYAPNPPIKPQNESESNHPSNPEGRISQPIEAKHAPKPSKPVPKPIPSKPAPKPSQPVPDPKAIPSKPAPIAKASISSKIFYSQHKAQQKTTNKIGVPSPTQHIEMLQNELDLTYYPEYLDGYNSLSINQKKLLSAIKAGDLPLVKYMITHNIGGICSDINFGECQVLRECVLSNKLSILKYLKSSFGSVLDLNGESGYILRWSSRKGLLDIISYLLYEQTYQKIIISYFQYQCIEWSIVYRHGEIAKILQKYYVDDKLSTQWNVLQHSQQDLGVEFDIFNLPSIYQNIIEMIVNSDEENANGYICEMQQYYDNGCDFVFEHNMPWSVAVDCKNIAILKFLYNTVGVDSLSSNNHLLRTALDLGCVQLLRFAKSCINYEKWKQFNVDEFKVLCRGNEVMIEELENYSYEQEMTHTTPEKHKGKNNEKSEFIPQTPIPWPYEQPYVKQKYGILTRSKRKLLVKKGILQDVDF